MKRATGAWSSSVAVEALSLLLLLGSTVGCSAPPQYPVMEPPSVMYTPVSYSPLSPDRAYGLSEDYGDPAKAEEAQELHQQILGRHLGIGELYKYPFVWGAGTKNPICCVFVPDDDWDSLPEDSRELLAHYAASFVDKVKSDPFRYMGVLQSAPTAPLLCENVRKMTRDSWGIVVGCTTNGGRDIRVARIPKSGIVALMRP